MPLLTELVLLFGRSATNILLLTKLRSTPSGDKLGFRPPKTTKGCGESKCSLSPPGPSSCPAFGEGGSPRLRPGSPRNTADNAVTTRAGIAPVPLVLGRNNGQLSLRDQTQPTTNLTTLLLSRLDARNRQVQRNHYVRSLEA